VLVYERAAEIDERLRILRCRARSRPSDVNTGHISGSDFLDGTSKASASEWSDPPMALSTSADEGSAARERSLPHAWTVSVANPCSASVAVTSLGIKEADAVNFFGRVCTGPQLAETSG
jgi:hypothetical protein